MTANDSKCYLGYLNKLVDRCNNAYHCSVGTKPVDTDYSVLIGVWLEIKLSYKAPKFEIGDRVRMTRILLAKFTLKIGQEKNL